MIKKAGAMMTVKKLYMLAEILGVALAASAAVGKYVQTKIDARVDSLQVQVTDHINSPGHPQELQEVREMHQDLQYIKGRIDSKWGKIE